MDSEFDIRSDLFAVDIANIVQSRVYSYWVTIVRWKDLTANFAKANIRYVKDGLVKILPILKYSSKHLKTHLFACLIKSSKKRENFFITNNQINNLDKKEQETSWNLLISFQWWNNKDVSRQGSLNWFINFLCLRSNHWYFKFW